MCYEMMPGATWDRISRITLAEFNLLLTGYHHRQEKEINQTRNTIAAILNIQGKVLKKEVTPQGVWPLDMDRAKQKRMITTMAQAMKLLKEYL